MSEEKIWNKAREFAEKALEDYEPDYSCEWEGEVQRLAENCVEFVKLLSKDYCIVPKVEVLNQHAWHMQRMKEVSSNRQMNRAKAIALENLFGREMFEQKGE